MLSGVDLALRRTSVSWIDWYQRVLSPRKGFACAHRVRHGSQSCSQFARIAFEQHSWWRGLWSLAHRLRQCGEAARAIRAEAALSQTDGLYDEQLDQSAGEQKTDRPRDCEQEACACVGRSAGPPLMMECADGCVRAISGAVRDSLGLHVPRH